MICQKCGAENPEDSSFCNKCGANLLLVNKKKDRLFVGIINKMKLFSSKRNVIILCSVLAFIICLSVGLAYLNDPISSFKSDIRNNNYINAVKIYNEKIKGNTNKENNANWFLKDEILKIEKSFIEGKINFDTAKTRLETIRKTQLVSVDVITTIDKITKLNDSKIAFSKAEEFLKNKDVVNAIKEYKKVIQDDQNYERAREQIINNEKQYKEQVLKGAEDSANANNYDKAISLLRVALSLMPNDSDLNSRLSVYQKEFEEKLAALQLVIVESAKIIVQDSRYKVLYPDMIQVIVKNTSDKTIKDMKIGCLGYDKNGYPVKIKTQYDISGGDYEFVGNAPNVNIIAGSKFGEDKGWKLHELHGISKVLACVKSATFYDGTPWENPYYEYWVEKYKEKPLN